MNKVDKAIDLIRRHKDLNAVVSKSNIRLKDTEGLPLDNTAIVIKDNISTKDEKTTASSMFLQDYQPVFDATVVEKLKEAGATIIAKTMLDEFAMGGFGLTANGGPVLNPLDKSRVAGGSSAGSAALVAVGAVDMALGTDTGDSCRIPASYCGIIGFKPTYGRISRYGVMPYSNSLDHVGMFANSVENTAKLFENIAGYDKKDMTSSKKEVEAFSTLLDLDLSNKKIGIIDNVINAINNQEIKDAFNNLIKKVEEKVLEVKNVQFNQQLFRNQNAVYKIIANAEAVSNHANLNGIAFGKRGKGDSLAEIMTSTRSENIGLQAKKRYLIGGYSLDINNIDKTFLKAKKVRRLIKEDINNHLKDVDFFMAPASGKIAPKLAADNTIDLDSDEHLIANSYMVMDNFTGNPGIVLPMTKVDGMPVGVYISSKAFNEAELLSLAKLVEEIVGESK